MKESIIVAIFLLGPMLVIGTICMIALTILRYFWKWVATLFVLSGR